VRTYDYIVLISLDTLRSDCIGVNPYRLWPDLYPDLRPPRTAVLDEMATSGAFFPNAISAAPYTSASHGTFLTGQYPLKHGVFEFYGGRLSSPTVFTYARSAGYRTIATVDFPIILGEELGFTRDIDRYLIEDEYGFCDALLQANRSVGFAHFGGIHVPYGFHKLRFGGDDYRRTVEQLESELPTELPLHLDELTETYRESEDVEVFLRYKRALHYFFETRQFARIFDLYLRGLEYFLESRFAPFLERLQARLEASGRNYLIVLFGDHGHEFSAASFGNFNSFAEGVVRVPVIVKGTGIQQGMFRQRIRTADVLPTILELAGLQPDPRFPLDGVSWAGVLRDGAPPPADAVALCQAYTADANDFVDYQRRQLAGLSPEPIRHVKLFELAYVGDYRVLQRSHEYTANFDRIVVIDEPPQVERFDANLKPVAEPGRDPSAALALLKAYNEQARSSVRVIAGIETRSGLRNMGYRV
jgi:choline-sulfatase